MKYKTLPLSWRIQRFTYNPKYIRHATYAGTTVLAALSYIAFKTSNPIAGIVLLVTMGGFPVVAIRYNTHARKRAMERIQLIDFQLAYQKYSEVRLARYEWGSPEWFEQLQPFAGTAIQQGPAWVALLKAECQQAKTSYVRNHQ